MLSSRSYSLSIKFTTIMMSCIVVLMTTSSGQDMPMELQKAFEAHGGLDTWNAKNTLNYRIESSSGSRKNVEEYTINLKNRHERIKGSNYEMGFDGKQYWQLLKEEGIDEKNPRFFTNLQFYFFAMPFVVADPGVRYESLGIKEIGEEQYYGVKISFDPGTGEAPDDQYLLFLDKNSYQLKILLYSVTYFDKNRAERYSARYYKDWQKVDGIWVPKEVVRHDWDSENERLGEEKGIVRFPFVEFELSEPDEGIFTPPEQAKVEPK